MSQEAFKIVWRGKLAWLECVRLARLPWLLHAFSTRRGGVSQGTAAGLNLGFNEADRRANVEENRKLFFGLLGADLYRIAALRQIHSAEIYQVVRGVSGKLAYRASGNPLPRRPGHSLPAGDALMADQPGILLSVGTADCLPLLIVDTRQRAVAVVHAGWRGALARIVEKVVGEMLRLFVSRPADLLAAGGPSIRVCCYEVGEEVVSAFCGRFASGEKFFERVPQPIPSATARPSSRLSLFEPHFAVRRPLNLSPRAGMPASHLDLVAVVRDQLRSAGVSPARVYVANLCTACRTDLFFSHRKEGNQTGRMMTVIGTRPG